ncbi:MAG: 3-oxoacyl-ACP synthase [Pirellulaceae bacterium]|nr:3-oxoacyl-ACP synthase [Pirellulaceae bacterium]
MLLTHSGMICPVGLNAAAACAAMRAGIAGFAELPFHDRSDEPIVGAAVPGVPPGLTGDARLLFLLEKALSDCLSSAGFDQTDSIPLLVGLSEAGRPGGGDDLAGDLIRRVQKQLGRNFHPSLSRCFSRGHTAGFESLRVSREMLQDRRIPACVVAGVDSYLNDAALVWLDGHNRLKSPDNTDGVIPGEAAAAVIARRDASAPSSVHVIGLGFGKETAHVLSDEPLLGLGLTAAVRAALAEANLGFHDMAWRVSDVTGEQYGFKEIPLVEGRLVRTVRKDPQPLWHCADSIGDIGAAAGVAQLVMIHHAYLKGYAPGDKAICLTSSVPGDRAAVVVGHGNGQAGNVQRRGDANEL